MIEPQVIRIHGGLGDAPTVALIGGEEVSRQPGEALDAFEARCMVLARERGARLVVVGGLPG